MKSINEIVKEVVSKQINESAELRSVENVYAYIAYCAKQCEKLYILEFQKVHEAIKSRKHNASLGLSEFDVCIDVPKQLLMIVHDIKRNVNKDGDLNPKYIEQIKTKIVNYYNSLPKAVQKVLPRP